MPIKYGSAKVTRVLRVIDGDTFVVNLNRFSPIAGKNISIRIRGFNAVELRTKNKVQKEKAVRAQTDLKLLLDSAGVIKLYNIERGKYFRLIADVYIDNVNLLTPLRRAQQMRLNVAGF